MQTVLRWWRKIKWKYYLTKLGKPIPIPASGNNLPSISDSVISIDVLSHYLLGVDHKAWYQVVLDTKDMNRILPTTELKFVWNYIVLKMGLTFLTFDNMPNHFVWDSRKKLAQYDVLRDEIICLVKTDRIKSSGASPNAECNWSNVTIGRDNFLKFIHSVNSGDHRDFGSRLVFDLFSQRPFWKAVPVSISKNKEKHNIISPFPADQTRRPQDATVIITSEVTFTVSVKGNKPRHYEIGDIGLTDKRKKELPAKVPWKILCRLSEAQEYTKKMAQLDSIDDPEPHLTDLRNIFRNLLGIHGDPFPWSQNKWTPSIHLVDERKALPVRTITVDSKP